MEECPSKRFGVLEYQPEHVIQFPYGLPAFEKETRFLPVEEHATAPVTFLQSLRCADLCFITLPVQTIDPDYQLEVAAEDLEALELPGDAQPVIGADVLCLVLLTVNGEHAATANLMAPLVINLRTGRGLQVIQANARYSHEHPLTGSAEEDPECS